MFGGYFEYRTFRASAAQSDTNFLKNFQLLLQRVSANGLKQFDILLSITNLKVSNIGEPRTMYSLRHSCIMFRLMFGRAVDTLTLARNARTSPEMIDRFYAAPLQGEMNVGELQSKRRPRPWE